MGTYSQMYRTGNYSQNSSIIWLVWLNGWVFIYKQSISELQSLCSHLSFGFRASFEQRVTWHSGSYRVWFTLKRVPDMTGTSCLMPRTDKNLQQSSIIWPVWLNGSVFIYIVSASAFESRCSHSNVGLRDCFEQGVPSHSGNYRVWIYCETGTWHDKNIHWNALYR